MPRSASAGVGVGVGVKDVVPGLAQAGAAERAAGSLGLVRLAPGVHERLERGREQVRVICGRQGLSRETGCGYAAPRLSASWPAPDPAWQEA